MPANLSHDYKEAEARYRAAKTTEDKLRALEDMLSTIPKHKGTDRMQGDIKRRISKLRSGGQKKGGAKQSFSYYVDKEGAAQIFVIGPPNSGKSSLLKATTNTDPAIADYAFTTRKTLPGMMKFEDVPIQLVDTPPFSHEYTEPWLTSVIRNGEMYLLFIDVMSDDPIADIEMVKELVEQSKIRLVRDRHGRDQTEVGWKSIPTLLICNKIDHDPDRDLYKLIEELYAGDFIMLAISILTDEGLDDLRRLIYEELHIIRVYPKTPGKPADMDSPVILQKGSTLLDFAKSIHKDFAHKLKFARIWGAGKYDGQKVSREYVIQDKDVIELHM